MGGFRKIKPALYLAMTCVSLYGASRLVEPLLALREKGLGPQAALGLLTGAPGAKTNSDIAKQLPAGAGDLNSLLARAGLASSDGTAADAAPAEPREIIIRDVRFVDQPRAHRDLFAAAIEHQSKGQLAQAESLYLQILAADPDDTGVHRNLAVLYCQMEKYEQSWRHVHALRDLGREMPEGFIDVLSAAMEEPGA